MSCRVSGVASDIKKVMIVLFILALICLAYIVDKASTTERVKKAVANAAPAIQAAENETAKR